MPGLPPWRLALRRTLAILLGAALGLAVAEAVARWAGPRLRPHLRNRVYFAEPDALLGWRNRAGFAGPYGGEEFLTRVTINPAGQRGPSHPIERTPGTRRIAVLGDSQAWGDGVADDATFAARLDGEGLEVLNFSSLGYGTDQQLLSLRHHAAAYRPDVVVVAVFVGNDLSDNLSRGTYQYPKPWFALEAGGRLRLEGVPVEPPRWLHALVELHRFAMRHSVLLNAIAAAARPPDRGAEQTPEDVRLWDTIYEAMPSDADRRGLEMTIRLLREIARETRALGAEPVILLLPESWQVGVAQRPRWRAQLRARGADWRRPQKVLRRALAPEGVRIIDALPALVRATRDGETADATPTYYRRWRHLNAHGHAVIADLLERRLGLAEWRAEHDARRRSPP
jgi:lysophospholipase L1-like esterase